MPKPLGQRVPNAHVKETCGVAFALAAELPTALLPCPVCLAGMRGAILAAHVTKVHGVTPTSLAGPVVLRGDARVLRPVFGTAFVVWCLFFALCAVNTHLLDVPTIIALGATFAFAFGGLCASLAGAIPAFIELSDDTLRMRLPLGITARTITLPCVIEGGSILVVVPHAGVAADIDAGASDVRAGAYLRLVGAHTITIGGRDASGLGRRWAQAGWTKAPARKRWDVTLDADALVAVEYWLARRELLSAKMP